MPIEFRCPQCQKLLRVASESAGAKAKCPQCGAISDVPRESAESDQQTDPAGWSSGQGANRFTQDTDPVNPYSSPASGHAQVGPKPSLSGEVVATPVDPGLVINYAWEVWKSNLGILIGISFVVLGANIGISVVQGVVTEVYRQQGNEELGALIGFVISAFNNAIQIFLGIGQTQIVLKLLRGQPAEFGGLFGGGPLFLRVLGASFLAGIALFAGVLACVIPAIILAVLFWPFYFLIVDHKAKAIDSFGMASPLGKANVGTTIILWLASMGIMLVGVLACLVGVVFATPLVSMLWGTAYLGMSGQLKLEPQN
jgi:phage FluMu protein Com